MAKKKNPPPPPPEVEDIHELFCYYNSLYFGDSLGACLLSWDNSTSSRTSSQFQQDGVYEIHLSKRLKLRPAADLKNTLLHEMIHAFLWVQHGNTDRNDHGPEFQALVDSISKSTKDCKKPPDGYKITASHAMNNKKVDNKAVDCWTCELCGELINGTGARTSENKCVDNVGPDEACSNASCHWHRHKEQCPGSSTNPRKRAKRNERLNHAGNEELNENKSSPLHNGQASEKSLETENFDSGKSKTITKFFELPSDANRKSLKIVEPSQIPPHAEKDEKAKVSESNDGDVILYGLPKIAKLKPTKLNNYVTSSKVKKRVKLKAESEKDNGRIKFPEVTDDCRRSRSKPIYISTNKRKYGKQMQEFTVRSQWIEMYLDEEDEEEIVPLVNHRSEMRKKQKLMTEDLGLQRCVLHILNAEPANISVQTVDATARFTPVQIEQNPVAMKPNFETVCKDVEEQDYSADVIDLSD